MAKARPSVQKRMKELAKLEKRQAKAKRRDNRDSSKVSPMAAAGIDPDLAGIVAGPQPKPAWAVEDEEEAASY